MQIYENSHGHLILELPRMLGSRAKAVSVVSELPDFLDDKTVEVIATDSIGAHHSFIDEFCTQILVYRNARELIFVDPPKMMEQSISFYGIVREYSNRITLEYRTK